MRTEGKAAAERTGGQKRLLAYGKKINGTWEVRTFLRAAAGGIRHTFWETAQEPRRAKRRK
jgi:hypothetical protein